MGFLQSGRCRLKGTGWGSTQADLAQDALAVEQFGAEANHEAEHGQAAISSLSKGHKAKMGGGDSHGLKGEAARRLHGNI